MSRRGPEVYYTVRKSTPAKEHAVAPVAPTAPIPAPVRPSRWRFLRGDVAGEFARNHAVRADDDDVTGVRGEWRSKG